MSASRTFLQGVFLVVSLSVLACAKAAAPSMVSPLSEKSSDPDAEQAFRKAEVLWRNGDVTGAKHAFQEFIHTYPEDRLRASASLYLGRIALATDELAVAEELLSNLVGGPQSSTTDYARLYLGQVLFRQSRFQEAIAILEPYAGRFPNREDHLNLLETLWRSALGSGDHLAEIRWIEQYLLSNPPPSGAQEARGAVTARVLEMMDMREIESLLSELQEKDWVYAMVMARLASRNLEEGHTDEAQEIVSILKSEFSEGLSEGDSSWQEVRAVMEQVAERSNADMNAVGVLLPLSGRNRIVGDAALKGAMLAAKQFGIGVQRIPMTVVIKDTGGDPAKAAQAVTDLVEKDRVAAIIGPMDVEEAEAAAARAEALGVPMIALSSREGLGSKYSVVFRRSASNSLEVKALLDAVSPVAGVRMAVLYPETGYGKKMQGLMATAIVQREAVLATSVSFPAEQTDFTQTVKSLVGADFDVLLLPMTAAQLALAAPSLAAAGIWPDTDPKRDRTARKVSWLVPSVGYSEQLVQRAGRYLQDALFVSLYNPAGSAAARSMRQSYVEQYRSEPNLWAAYCYDAVSLIGQAVAQGVDNRLSLRDWLRTSGRQSAGTLRLVIPFSGFDSNGESSESPPVFRLIGNQPEFLP